MHADAERSSRFLTAKKAEELVRKISKLGSKYMAKDLIKKIHVEGRVTTAEPNRPTRRCGQT